MVQFRIFGMICIYKNCDLCHNDIIFAAVNNFLWKINVQNVSISLQLQEN